MYVWLLTVWHSPSIIDICEIHMAIINVCILIPNYFKARACEENDSFNKETSQAKRLWYTPIFLQISHNIFLLQYLNIYVYKQKNINGIFEWDIITLVTRNIFSICIRCIWFNETYIIPNFYRNTLLCDRAIGLILSYHKWDLIWSFIFVCSIISEHDFISDFVLVFNCFIIFKYIIFINFRVLLLTY